MDLDHQSQALQFAGTLTYPVDHHDGAGQQLATAFDFHPPAQQIEQRINAASYHFDPAIFTHPIVRPYVEVTLGQDTKIYNLIREMFTRVPSSIGSRPSYPLATDANFSEAAYIAANPDVRDALSEELIPSARQHFDDYGQLEGRRLLSSLDPTLAERQSNWPNPPPYLT